MCWEVRGNFPKPRGAGVARVQITGLRADAWGSPPSPFPEEAQGECGSHCPQRSEASEMSAGGVRGGGADGKGRSSGLETEEFAAGEAGQLV